MRVEVLKKFVVVVLIGILLLSITPSIAGDSFTDWLLGRSGNSSSEEEPKRVTLGGGNGDSTTTYGNGWKKTTHPDGTTDYTMGVKTFQRHDAVWCSKDDYNSTVSVSSDPLYDYDVREGQYLALFKANPSTAQSVKLYATTEDYFTFQPHSLNYRNDLSQIQQISITQSVTGTTQENKFSYLDVFGAGLDLAYTYNFARFKEELTISSNTTLPTPEQYIIDGGNTTLDLDFLIDFPSSVDCWVDGEVWDKKNEKTSSHDVVFKKEGETIYTLPKPYATSNGSVYGDYVLKKQGGKLYIALKIPYEWLSDAINRTYPIVIDPTWVVGSGGDVWGGNVSFDDTIEDDISGYIILNGTQNSTNIAQGKTASADSVFSATYDATKALDGNIATSWLTQDGPSYPTNWTVDLGTNASIWNVTALQSHFTGYLFQYYEILVSKDNIEYSVLVDNRSRDNLAPQEPFAMKNNSVFLTRYIRIKGNVPFDANKGVGMCEVYIHKNDNSETGNLTSWYDAGSGNETYKLSVNFTFPTNTNASINLYNNGTGAFIETLATNNNTEQWSKTITSAVQDSKVNITLYGNVTETPEVHNITFHTQTAGAANPVLEIGNNIAITNDWGQSSNSNITITVSGATANETNVTYNDIRLTNVTDWGNKAAGTYWDNQSISHGNTVSNEYVEVKATTTSSGGTNDTEYFWLNTTKRTNTATMDSNATQTKDVNQDFYVNATCNEEYGDTFYGSADLLEDGSIIATETPITNYTNFTHNESVAGQYNYTVRFYNTSYYDNATTSSYSNVTVSDVAAPVLTTGNISSIQEDWGRPWTTNFSASVTAEADNVWMNFSNAEFTNGSLENVLPGMDEWVNESHNVASPVTNVSVTVTLNSTTAGSTNDTDTFYYEITKRTNTPTMDSASTQSVYTNDNFWINASITEEYGDSFNGSADLLEDGDIVSTTSPAITHANFSRSEGVDGQYNFTVRFYNLTHYVNVTTSTYSNVTVSILATTPSISDETPTSPVLNDTSEASVTFGATVNQSTASNEWIADWGGGNTTLEWDNATASPTYTNTTFNQTTGDQSYTIYLKAYNNSDESLNTSTSWVWNVSDVTPPASITGLTNSTYATSYINWTWTNPGDGDFNRTMVYINESFEVNITTAYYNDTGLTANTQYNISTRTVDASDNINQTWVNTTSTTAAEAPSTYIPPDPVNLANTTYLFGVNFTFAADSGNVTDGFNLSWSNDTSNGWENTTATFFNHTTAAHDWVNVSIWAYNSSGIGTLSTNSISDEVQMGNNAMSLTVTQAHTKLEGETVFISDTSSSDADSDTPTYSCNRTDLFTDFSTITGYGNWTTGTTDAGTYYVDIGVSDGYGSTDNKTLTITINEATPTVPSSIVNDTSTNFWINWSWTKGSNSNLTDVLINGSWVENSTDNIYNGSYSAHATKIISLREYNSTLAEYSSFANQTTTISNNAPTLTGLPDNTTNEDTNQTDIFDLDDYFSDADSDAPTYLVESNNQSANVSVTINGTTNTISYTLAANWYGVASVVINATDGYGGEDNDTFLITVNSVNDVPTTSNLQTEGQTNPTQITDYTPDFTWSYSDPVEGDTQSHWQIYVGTTSGVSDKWDSGELAGTDVADVYAGSSLSGATTYYVQVRTKDGTDWSSWTTGTFKLLHLYPATPTNLAHSTGNFWVNHTFDVGAGDYVTTNTYNVSKNGTWDNSSATLFRNTTLTAHDWQNISIWAWNNTFTNLSTASISQNTQIPNNAISITNTSDWSGDEGGAVYLDFDFTDVDSDTGTFATNATDGSLNTSTGIFTWTTAGGDAGTYSWIFNVSDGYGSISSYIPTITVAEATHNVSGYIFDATGAGIAGVSIINNVTAATNTSLSTGYYKLTGLVNGTYLVTASKTGYTSNSTTVTVAGVDLTNQNITMTVTVAAPSGGSSGFPTPTPVLLPPSPLVMGAWVAPFGLDRISFFGIVGVACFFAFALLFVTNLFTATVGLKKNKENERGGKWRR